MLLSIIIPAYNEEKRLPKTIQTLLKYLSEEKFDFEILVVDDGSKDNTVRSIVQSEKVRVIEQKKNQGKGAAVRSGMQQANGDLLLFTDADLSTPIFEIKKLIDKLNSGFDIAIGSRALQKELIKEHQPFYRESMGKIFNKLVSTLVFSGIKDTQCGFKLFSKNAAKEIFSIAKINGFAFDVELLFLAKKLNFKVAEVPVEWYNDDRSSVNPITDSIKMFLEILKIRKIHS